MQIAGFSAAPSRLTSEGHTGLPFTEESGPKWCVATRQVHDLGAAQPPGSLHPPYGSPPTGHRWVHFSRLLRHA